MPEINKVEGFFNKKMDRREFLLKTGLLLLTFIGIGKFLNLGEPKNQSEKGGYGSSPYGK